MAISPKCFSLIGAACCIFLLCMSQLLLNNYANGRKGQDQRDILVTNKSSSHEMQQSKTVMSQLLLNNYANGRKGQDQRDILVTNKSSSHEMQQSKTVILVYTTFYPNQNWVIMGERCAWYEHEERQCPWDLFEITINRTRFAESNLVIFNGGFIPNVNELKSLWKSRPTSQRWVYHSWESPMNVMNPSPFNGLFNLTWTYRTDADISQPYGIYEPLSQDEIKKNEMAGVTDYTQGKSELVAWMVSNCPTSTATQFCP